jgi:hypothetical protein
MMSIARCLVFVVACAGSSLAAETLPEGIRACAQHQDRDQRLACFDAEVARLSSPAAVAQNFGVTRAMEQSKQSTQPNEITARVTDVATRPHGELVLTLDNGQVWQQIEAVAGWSVKAGDQVIIRSGAFSSYRLLAPSGRATKVTRTK